MSTSLEDVPLFPLWGKFISLCNMQLLKKTHNYASVRTLISLLQDIYFKHKCYLNAPPNKEGECEITNRTVKRNEITMKILPPMRIQSKFPELLLKELFLKKKNFCVNNFPVC